MTLKYETIRTKDFLCHCRHDQEHRLDGPAFMWHNGVGHWMEYGMSYKVIGPNKTSTTP